LNHFRTLSQTKSLTLPARPIDALGYGGSY
jgi:hypothetical protein